MTYAVITPVQVGLIREVAPNVQRYLNTSDTPGTTVIALKTLGTNTDVILNQFSRFGSECGERSRDAYDDGFYTGERIIYRSGGEIGAANVNVAAFPEDRSYSVFVNVQLVEECDEEAYRNIRDFLQVTGEF